jgi:hypothetical protein
MPTPRAAVHTSAARRWPSSRIRPGWLSSFTNLFNRSQLSAPGPSQRECLPHLRMHRLRNRPPFLGASVLTKPGMALRIVYRAMMRSVSGSVRRTSLYTQSVDRSARSLTRQHEMLTRAFEGRLIFSDIELSKGSRILDSGTGSGT